MKVNHWVIWCLVLGVLLLWALIGSAILYFSPGLEEAGQFGDLFGAVNALFSGIALAGVLVAIILQSKELELQREELKLTREEHKEHNRLVKSQLKEVLKQAEERKDREEFLADPAFNVVSTGVGSHYNNYDFVNQGGPISVSEVSWRPSSLKVSLSPEFFLPTGDKGKISVEEFSNGLELVDSFRITLVYIDSLKRKRTVELTFERKGGVPSAPRKFKGYKIRDYVDPLSGSL